MGCPPVAEGVTQLKKNPTEENRKQTLLFRRIPKDRIIYHNMTDSPQIKNSTRATPGISHFLSASLMASRMAPKSSP